jgi:hypothetical protein
LAEAIRAGFVDRGVGTATAALVAELTVTVLYVALDEWLDPGGDRTLFEIITETFESLQTVLAFFADRGSYWAERSGHWAERSGYW